MTTHLHLGSMEEKTIERTDLNGNGLFVESNWREDRFVHSIGIVVKGHRHTVLRSIEGDSSDQWPISPPLQQISTQVIDDNPVMLGVGMAGTSHYSSSFLLHCEQNELLVESACLLKNTDRTNTARRLIWGTTYRIESTLKIESLDGNEKHNLESQMICCRESNGLPQLKITLENCQFEYSTSKNSELQADQLKIAPAQIQTDEATQWKYKISFV